jgi:hypothetical protein
VGKTKAEPFSAYNCGMYMFAPLAEHYDDGFGAVADAFRDAAKKLREGSGEKPFQWGHLPETYLLRHAIELYLKSGIIIVHRKLRMPYGSEPYTSRKPLLLTSSGKWEELYNTHDLVRLFWYWKKLIDENKEKIAALLSAPITDGAEGMEVPAELSRWIGRLGSLDPSGDYLRYPMSKNVGADAKKSSFKEVAFEELVPEKRKDNEYIDNEYIKVMLVENSKGEVVKSFKYDSATGQDVAEAAREAVEILNNYHAMMRFGLTDGW